MEPSGLNVILCADECKLIELTAYNIQTAMLTTLETQTNV